MGLRVVVWMTLFRRKVNGHRWSYGLPLFLPCRRSCSLRTALRIRYWSTGPAFACERWIHMSINCIVTAPAKPCACFHPHDTPLAQAYFNMPFMFRSSTQRNPQVARCASHWSDQQASRQHTTRGANSDVRCNLNSRSTTQLMHRERTDLRTVMSPYGESQDKTRTAERKLLRCSPACAEFCSGADIPFRRPKATCVPEPIMPCEIPQACQYHTTHTGTLKSIWEPLLECPNGRTVFARAVGTVHQVVLCAKQEKNSPLSCAASLC